MLITELWWIALLPIFWALGSILVHYARTGVPPIPSSQKEIADVITLLQGAGLAEDATIYELGCGIGSMAIAIGRAFPKARVIGLEVSPIPCWVARWRARGHPSVSIRRADFSNDPSLCDADAVTAYLMIGAAARLAELLDRRLRPGAHVVASTFWFRDRAPIATLRMAARYRWPARPVENEAREALGENAPAC